MSAGTTRIGLMTAEEFGEWVERPENANRWFELVHGEVIELPPPTKRHGVVTGNATRLLGNFTFQRRKGYVASNDAGVVLGREPDTVRGPDVALYEDVQKFDEVHPKYGEVAPRLALEILSPGDRIGRVMRKILDYLRCGVGLVWLIDPEARNVTVYRPGKEPYVVEEDHEITGDDVLPDLRLRVGDFFSVPGEEAKG